MSTCEPQPYGGQLLGIDPGETGPDHAAGSPGLSHLKPGPDDRPPTHLPEAGQPQVSGADGAIALAHLTNTNPAPEPREA